MFAHCILLDNSFLWGRAKVQTAILCYKVTLKLIFRSLETAQLCKSPGSHSGFGLEAKVAVPEGWKMNA